MNDFKVSVGLSNDPRTHVGVNFDPRQIDNMYYKYTNPARGILDFCK